MNFRLRKFISWPLALAGAFFLFAILLSISYPSSIWMVTDNDTIGIADALNMAYRLADRQMYEAVGMSYHPAVQFYLMSWLALALSGYPVAYGDFSFFSAVMEHIEVYHRMILCLAALAGAAGVYVFARAARNLVPAGVTVTAMLVWLVSTPATLLMFLSPGMESFAIIINGLFLAVMVPLAYEKDIDAGIVVFAGCVGAFAYLNKLSYIYVPLALGTAIFVKLLFSRAGWLRQIVLLSIFLGTFILVTLAAAFLIIGWDGFCAMLAYHKGVILGSELYGTGEQTVVSTGEIRRAIAAMADDRAYAVPIALFGGTILVIAGLITGLKRVQQVPVAVLSIASGVAALLSAIAVLKHYEIHYTAGVSATLPSCVVCGYLIAKIWGLRLRLLGAALAAIAILLMTVQVSGPLINTLANSKNRNNAAKADLEDINSALAGNKRTVEFAYKTPFRQFGEGFVITYASVPRLTYEYLQSRTLTISSMLTNLVTRDVGAYVIDKNYFRDVQSVKAAPNLALLDPNPVKYKDGDTLIELRTVFLLIRG